MEGTFNIKVKYLSEKNFEVSVNPDELVGAVKEKCSPHVDNTPASDIKLIYRGKILNNGDTVQACKLEGGSTLHLVKSKPQGSNPQPTGGVTTNMPGQPNNLQQPTTSNTNASLQNDPMAGLGNHFIEKLYERFIL